MTERITKFFASLVTPSPARDWTISLILLIFFFLSLIAYAAYLFIGIRQGTIVGNAPEIVQVLPNVSRAELMNTLEAYRVRRANFESGEF